MVVSGFYTADVTEDKQSFQWAFEQEVTEIVLDPETWLLAEFLRIKINVPRLKTMGYGCHAFTSFPSIPLTLAPVSTASLPPYSSATLLPLVALSQRCVFNPLYLFYFFLLFHSSCKQSARMHLRCLVRAY